MAKTKMATAAGETPAAANTTQTATTVATTTSTATAENATAAATEPATPKVKLFKFKMPALKKAAKAAKAAKEAAKRVTGMTINVATTSYNNWRSSAPYEENGQWFVKWGLTDLINGTDETVRDIARFIQYTPEEATTNGVKWAGYISVTPTKVAEVVALLNKWNHDNQFNEDGSPIPELDQTVEQFTILENFVEVPAKVKAPRKPKVKVEETAPEVTPVTDEVPA